MILCLVNSQLESHESLKAHKREVHNKLMSGRQSSCKHCGSKFAKWTLLKRHVRTEHGEFVCEHCDLELPDYDALKRHKWDEHNLTRFKDKAKIKSSAKDSKVKKKLFVCCSRTSVYRHSKT